MKFGMFVAIETDAVFAHYETITECPAPRGYRVYRTESAGCEIYILRGGMGIAAAAAGVQYLITKYGVDAIVDFGVVGGLSEEMKTAKVVIIDRVVHYKYDCSEFLPLAIGQVEGHDSIYLETDRTLLEKALALRPDLKPATLCSGDKFVGTEEEKRHLHDTFSGDVCDMEGAGIVLACEANGVPCLLFKAVSDSLTGGAEEFYAKLLEVSSLCLTVADGILSSL